MDNNGYQFKGRIRYVEPTLINDFEKSGRNYTSDLSNYCIGVDLTVYYPDIRSCGLSEGTGEMKEVRYSTNERTINFIGGTNGMLTTNYTDMDVKQPWNNTHECLGIKSIDINYEQFMYPKVNITFTDIRGASLIGSQEMKSNYGKGDGSFFSLLYAIPAPIYKLKVKGFYGKEVTYSLTMNKSSLTFNSQDGNFDVAVEFIGFLFGVYSDIPMTYLASAPYLPSGEPYWESQTQEGGRFMYKNGDGHIRMFTYPEFRMQVARAAESEEKKEIGLSKKKSDSQYETKRGKIITLIQYFPFIEKEGWIDNEDYIYTIKEKSDYRKEVSTKCKIFSQTLDEYNSSYYSDTIPNFSFVKNYTEPDSIYRYKYERTKKGYVLEGAIDERAKYAVNHIDKEDFKRSHPNLKVFYIYIIPKSKDVNMLNIKALTDKLVQVDRDKVNSDKEYERKNKQALCNAMGFPPTIKNMYNMAFAHMETFVYVFYSYLNNIKSQIESINIDERQKRMPEHYNMAKNNTDSLYDIMAPFPMFYREETNSDGSITNKAIWAGNLTNGNDLEEVKFVDEIVYAAQFYNAEDAHVSYLIEDELSANTPTSAPEVVSKSQDDIFKEWEQENAIIDNDDVKLSIYMTLKRMYERWFVSSGKERWEVVYDNESKLNDKNSKSDFANFVYIDSFYHNVSHRLIVNVEDTAKMLSQLMPTGNMDKTNSEVQFSLFAFLSEVAQKTGGNLSALPVKVGITDKESLIDTFKAFSYNSCATSESGTYVFLYPYEPSYCLDTNSGYDNDGFDLIDRDGTISNNIPESLIDTNEEDGYIGSFGITFAKQNQSYFTNVTLDMDKNMITEASIAGQMNIASAGGQSPRETALYAQDIYKEYTRYMFNCNVTMMGDAQIMPLMYFQLNNIPMWRGTYMIKQVNHNITQGDMKTQFVGYRMNKNTIPLVEGSVVSLSETEWTTENPDDYINA